MLIVIQVNGILPGQVPGKAHIGEGFLIP